jgi:hypothetical protein
VATESSRDREMYRRKNPCVGSLRDVKQIVVFHKGAHGLIRGGVTEARAAPAAVSRLV